MGVGPIEIFVLNVESRVLHQLTDDRSFNVRPSWSGDGRWIYYCSNKSGTRQIWKIPVEGGNARQLTKGGGFEAVEVPGGKILWYTRAWTAKPGLWRVSVDGGEEVPVLDSVPSSYWAMTDNGIYYVDFSAVPEGAPKPLKFFSFEKREVAQVATIEKVQFTDEAGFSASRDGRWVSWRQLDRSESNIMLIDNFR